MKFYENLVYEDYNEDYDEFPGVELFQKNLVFIEKFLKSFETIPKVFIDIINNQKCI